MDDLKKGLLIERTMTRGRGAKHTSAAQIAARSCANVTLDFSVTTKRELAAEPKAQVKSCEEGKGILRKG